MDSIEPIQNLQPNLQSEVTAFSPLPEKANHLGRGEKGRLRTFYETIELLQSVRESGKWPGGTLERMQFYYKKNYPEYFSNGKRAEQARAIKEEKAHRIKATNRPRRKKVQGNTGPPSHSV